MALLIGVGLAVALAYGLVVAVVRWIRLSPAKVRLPTHTREVSLGGSCDPPPTVRVVAPRWIAGASALVELVAGSRSYTATTRVGGGSLTTIEIACASVPRGLYRLQRVTVRITDVLSLFAVVLDSTVPGDLFTAAPLLRVLPVASSLAEHPVLPGFVVGRRGDGSSRDRSDDLIEARPYHPGDDTRRINWKAYAHSESLFVRIGEEIPPPAFSADVVVDTRGLDSSSHLDRLIAAGLAVAEELERRDYAVTLAVHVDEGGPRRLGTIDEGRRVLAAVDPVYGILPDGDRAAPPVSRNTEGHTLVVGSGRSPDAPPGALPGQIDAILVWDHEYREGGRHGRTISFLE